MFFVLSACEVAQTDAQRLDTETVRQDLGKTVWIAQPHHVALCDATSDVLDNSADCTFVGGGPLRIVGLRHDRDGRIYYYGEFGEAVSGYFSFVERNFFEPSGPEEIDVLQSDAASMRNAKPPVPCHTGADCDAKWARALAWIKYVSHYPVWAAGDKLIQTDGPVYNVPAPAFTAQLVPGNAGLSWIFLAVQCSIDWVCQPSIDPLTANFAHFVGGA